MVTQGCEVLYCQRKNNSVTSGFHSVFPGLSIIIVHHRTPEVLRLCLKSIKTVLMLGHRKSQDSLATCDVGEFNNELRPAMSQDYLDLATSQVAKLDCEIIVVDSMSSRQSRDVVKEFQNNMFGGHMFRGSTSKHDSKNESIDIASRQIQICDVRVLPFDYNLGFSRGVNIGIREAKGQYILILNPDVVVTPGSIETMLEYMKAHPDIGILGPRVLNFNGTHQQTYFSYYKPATILARRTFLGALGSYKRALEEFVMSDTDSEKIQTPDWLMGSAIMVSREAVERVGPMDERFFMYFEDVDWARRFWHNDYKVVYYPKAFVYHYHQRESKSQLGLLDAFFNKKTRWHISSAIKFLRKYRDLKKTK